MDALEQWKSVAGWDGLYEVSSDGRVRSMPRRGRHHTGHSRAFHGRVLRPDCSTQYERVVLHRGGAPVKVLVHRLVAAAFLPEPKANETINHIDGDKRNNRPANLEWLTIKENIRHAWRTGLCKPLQGTRHGMASLADAQVKAIRAAAATGQKQRQIALDHGVSEGVVSAIVTRKSWKHLLERTEAHA